MGRGSRSNDELSMTRPRRRKTNYWYLAASAIIAILVIGSFALTGIGPGGGMAEQPRMGSSTVYQEGVGITQLIMEDTYPNPHISEHETVEYNTSPPTSGKHWDRWAECGFYDEELPDERITHNLEHGNIIVSYNLTEAGDIARLRGTLEDIDHFETWGLARYYDKIEPGQVALATWGVLDIMDGIDNDRIEDFFKTYSGTLGPEQIDCFQPAPWRKER